MTIYKVTLQAVDNPRIVHTLAIDGDNVGEVNVKALAAMQEICTVVRGHVMTVAYISKMESNGESR